MDAWIRDEIKGCDLGDQRLDHRLGRLLEDLSERIGKPIPLACQDWAATKAAYRFLDNEKVNEAAILEGHFQATAARFAGTSGPILVLHDTTEFSYKRERREAIGETRKIVVGAEGDGRPRLHTVCGLLLHSSLVVTADGLPLGLAAAKFWTRKKFKGTNALKRKINPTRVPIEEKESCRWLQNLEQATELLGDPERCVHIGDRESDIYELFCAEHAFSGPHLRGSPGRIGRHDHRPGDAQRRAWNSPGGINR
jgi:Transposase DNA-binding